MLVTGARGGSPAIRAHLIAKPERDPLVVNLNEVARDGTRVVRAYDWDMTKRVHLIVVSDDLHAFMHVHPVLGADGHFRLRLRLPHAGLYHLYYDGVAHGLGRQIFRFDLPVARPAVALAARPLAPTSNLVRAGPYTVRISRLTIPVGEPALFHVEIRKNGKLATGLHPYLGAMGHGVLIGAADLSYLHVHAMDAMMMEMMGTDDCGDAVMSMMAPIPPDAPVSPKLQFLIAAPRAGAYKFWLQFRGGERNYVASWTLTARSS
ncbi:MAG TPA: hypothetical protein VIG32_01160 [Candidatus Baltobacteraceae bacterium]